MREGEGDRGEMRGKRNKQKTCPDGGPIWRASARTEMRGCAGRRRELLVLARPCGRASSSATRAHAPSAASSRTMRATAAFILTNSCDASMLPTGRRAPGAAAWEHDDPKNAACEDHEEARESGRKLQDAARTLRRKREGGKESLSIGLERAGCASRSRRHRVECAKHAFPPSGGAPNQSRDGFGNPAIARGIESN